MQTFRYGRLSLTQTCAFDKMHACIPAELAGVKERHALAQHATPLRLH